MDNFGDWLYYIIFLVVAIVSFVNSAKKKNRTETAVPPPPPPAYEEEPPVHIPSRAKIKMPPAPERAKKTGGYVPLFPNEGQRVLENAMSLPDKEANDISLVDKLELNSADSFRKAVIYSEILNRKY
ncbi:MAG: hypothetical protein LBF85_09470 [Tannerella sp.]|jgi:hypothetical protein|nr:hypothetical protein [Tannerella sp.]